MTWEDAILHVMQQRPSHHWTLTEIYKEVVKLPIVTTHHLEDWGGQPNYHHWVRSAIARIKKKREIKRVKRSTYQLIDLWCQVYNSAI